MYPEILIGSSSYPKTLEASKFLKAPMLLSENELRLLFENLKPFWLFKAGGVIKNKDWLIPEESFIENYKETIQNQVENKGHPKELNRGLFAAFLTNDPDSIYRIPINHETDLLKIKKPIIQVQMHTLSYSFEDGQFRSMVFGEGSFFFGLLFSYPQLMKNQETEEIIKIDQSPLFPNTKIFKKLLVWQRQNTTPTPFIVNNERVNVPARIGKECYRFINNHPALLSQGLKIALPSKG